MEVIKLFVLFEYTSALKSASLSPKCFLWCLTFTCRAKLICSPLKFTLITTNNLVLFCCISYNRSCLVRYLFIWQMYRVKIKINDVVSRPDTVLMWNWNKAQGLSWGFSKTENIFIKATLFAACCFQYQNSYPKKKWCLSSIHSVLECWRKTSLWILKATVKQSKHCKDNCVRS